MSLTVLNWPLIVCLIALLAMIVYQQRSRGSRRQQLNLETCIAHIQDVETGPGSRDRDGAGAEPKALAWGADLLRGPGRTLVVPAVIFFVFAGIGAVAFHYADPAAGSRDAGARSEPGDGADKEMLARLTDYTRSIEPETSSPPSNPADDPLLPDVNTMIERLAARLEAAPNDIKGWQMLGWSYLNTGHYEEAAAAYAKAMQLEPESVELKLAYGDAKAKARVANGANPMSIPPEKSETANAVAGQQGAQTTASLETMPAHEQEAVIRSMVDGLASRLEHSPRDVEGWTRLLRSCVVLGEREVAERALRKALAVFKEDAAAVRKITAAALELGLQLE